MPRKKRSEKKQRARGNGEGSIYWDESKKRYYAAITVRWNPVTGKPIRQKVSAKTQAEVLAKLRQLEMERSLGARLDREKVTVAEWLERWLTNYAELKLRDTVYPGYRSNMELHVIPIIGHIPLKDLQTDDVQTMINDLLKNGRSDKQKDKKEKPGLSRRTVEQIRAILHEALGQAKQGPNKLILDNPVDGTVLPPKVKQEVDPFTEEDAEKFLNFIIRHRLFASYFVAFFLGPRKGEILGLMWDDIDFDRKILEIKRELARIIDKETGKQYLDFRPTKTPKSERIIPLRSRDKLRFWGLTT